MMSDNIIVTASRARGAPVAIQAVQEELGDLKLYRIPEPVTIAAQSQKQVAMLQKTGVKFDRIYTASVDEFGDEPSAVPFLLRMKNVKDKGLGLPMPAGGVVLFEPVGGNLLLAGQDGVADRAIGDDVEFKVGSSPDVRVAVKPVINTPKKRSFRVTLTNARAVPVTAEILIPYELANTPKGLVRKNGGWMWRTMVPAGGEAGLGYELRVDRRR